MHVTEPGIVAVVAEIEPFKGNPFPLLEFTGAEVSLAPDPSRFNLALESRMFSFRSRFIKGFEEVGSGLRNKDWELKIPPSRSAGPRYRYIRYPMKCKYIYFAGSTGVCVTSQKWSKCKGSAGKVNILVRGTYGPLISKLNV